MSRKPQVLFLAHGFPPARGVGKNRLGAIARHLAQLGWKVSVVSPHPSLLRNPDLSSDLSVEMEQLGVRMVYTGHRWRFLTPEMKYSNQGLSWLIGGCLRHGARQLKIEDRIGWYREAYRACANFRSPEVDVVLASAMPFGVLPLARRLARRIGCPYVLDYRDLWTVGNQHPHDKGVYDSRRNRRQEAKTLRDCAALSVVSPSQAACLQTRFDVAAKTHVIPNGYDPIDFQGIDPIDFGHFAVVYCGNFYPPRGCVSPLLAALRRLDRM
jgi:glycosyltransferase involved in cell wall biosynthesis